MNIIEFSENELNLLLKNCKDADAVQVQKEINSNIMEIVKLFAQQKYSGFSAGYVLNIIERLLKYKPLTPLTGEDDEWEEVSISDTQKVLQNKRCPQVFKEINETNGVVYDSEGKMFSSDNGHTWWHTSESRVNVTLPYSVPQSPENVIIDNKDQRDYILFKIMDFICDIDISSNKQERTYISEDTFLNTLLPFEKFVLLQDKLVKFWNITKPIFNLTDNEDIQLWEVVNFVMESDREEQEKMEEPEDNKKNEE